MPAPFSVISIALLLAGAAFAQQPTGNEEQKDEVKQQAEAKDDGVATKEAKSETKKSDDKKSDKKKTDKKKTEEKKDEKKTEIRLIAPSGNYVDLVAPLQLDATAILLGSPAKQKSFYRLCSYLEDLEEEDELEHVVFDLSASVGMNSAQLDELSRRLAKLRQSGKKTVAWLENASNVHLAIAAACDHIIMADFGSVDMPATAMQSMFYKDAMDLVGVKASVVRAGDFKGAVEPYLNAEMSSHLREHYIKMLKAINAAQVSRIAKGRGLQTAKVRELQQRAILLPKDALAAGLVDQLAPFGSMKETVETRIGEPIRWTKPKVKAKRQMSMFELMGKIMSGPSATSSRIRDNTIAVLHLSGPIVTGKKKSAGMMVSGPIVDEIDKLIENDKIKGAVVRINSPGGSAIASEEIRQGLVRLAKKKPTVVSMGNIAASGGYWISCIDVPVYAEQATITGSIGVFSMKLSVGSLMRRVGVRLESIVLDDVGHVFAIDRPWNDQDKDLMGEIIDHAYDRFLSMVADCRGKSVDEVKPLAGGRVWSGTQAKQNGLVDEIGGLDDCLAVVAKKSKLDKYELIHRPVASSGLDILDLIGEGDEEEILDRSVLSFLVKSLKNRGLSLQTTATLLKDAIENSDNRPTVWLLNTAEISVR